MLIRNDCISDFLRRPDWAGVHSNMTQPAAFSCESQRQRRERKWKRWCRQQKDEEETDEAVSLQLPCWPVVMESDLKDILKQIVPEAGA